MKNPISKFSKIALLAAGIGLMAVPVQAGEMLPAAVEIIEDEEAETEPADLAPETDSETETAAADTETETETETEIIEIETEADEASDKTPKGTLHLRRGKALKKGDCIGITAPAYHIEDDDFNQTVLFLKKLGYKVKVTDSCTSSMGKLAGSDKQRADDLNALFADDEVDAILCLRGGYGCIRILDLLDYDMIAAHPKVLIGYSDITVLHTVLMQKCHLATVHGPMASSFNHIYSEYIQQVFKERVELEDVLSEDDAALSAENVFDMDISLLKGTPAEYNVTQFLNGITSTEPIGDISLPEGETLKTMVPGSAEGIIVGGNLTVLTLLLGTQYELRGDGAILFIEEEDEDVYQIEGMLRQLIVTGLTDRISGILIGEMTGIKEYEDRKLEDVLREFADQVGKPCIEGVPAGHGENNMFLPFGVQAEMTANRDGNARVTLLEAALE